MYDVTIQCIVFLIYFLLLKETNIYFRWDNTQQFFFILILKQFNRYSIISWVTFCASLQFILYYFICDIQIVKFVWNKRFFYGNSYYIIYFYKLNYQYNFNYIYYYNMLELQIFPFRKCTIYMKYKLFFRTNVYNLSFAERNLLELALLVV